MQNIFSLSEPVSVPSLGNGGATTKIRHLTFDLPGEKVNKLDERVLGAFDELLPRLEELGQKGEIDAMILFSGKPGNFIAGADIRLIQSAKGEAAAKALSAKGQEILNRWEDLPFPTIAAIEGACMGGGCELSLASTAILMSNDPAARIGLPEVLLGIIPGMGGCVRMPRKVGLAAALDLILTGKALTGERAARQSLADACLPREDFKGSATRWVHSKLKDLQKAAKGHDWLPRSPKLASMGGPVGSVLENTPMGRAFILGQARKGVMSKTKGQYPAPLEAIQTLSDTSGHFGSRLVGNTRKKAMDREATGFGRMAATPESAHLISLFFMTEEVKKSNGLPGTKPQGAAPDPVVRSAAVLGAGVMGGGIAQLFAEKKIPIRMKDINTQALGIGLQAAGRLFKRQMQQRRIKARDFQQRMNMISPCLDFSGFGAVDLVVEAIVEKMDVKKKVLSELEAHVRPDCVLASNTSSLSITEMQRALKNPGRFVGMHFFNPVHRMPLVEVIRGEKTDDAAVASVFQLSKKLGKTPIVVKDGAGFLVNRLLVPYLNEAIHLVSEGCPIPEIDAALVGFGMPMGPVELIDEVGVDVGDKVLHILHAAFGERMKPATLAGKLVESGRLGKKSGKGFYVYGGRDNREKQLDPAIYDLLGVQPVRGKISAEEMVDRCILPMANEACRCLEEGVVASASDVDLGMIMGTGFPPFRGGLMAYARERGFSAIAARLKELTGKYGMRFTPSEALLRQ